LKVTRRDRVIDLDAEAATRAPRAGLEPLGSDVLIEGTIRSATATEIVVVTPSLLPAGSRAFIVIDAPGDLPIVGLVEVTDQHVLLDDVAVELHLLVIRMSDENLARLSRV